MVRSNSKFCKGSKFDGSEQDDSHQTETFRGSSEAESFIGSTTSATIKRIRKGVARLTRRNKKGITK